MKLYSEIAPDLDVKAKPIKLLKENTRKYLCDLGKGKDFLGHGKQ